MTPLAAIAIVFASAAPVEPASFAVEVRAVFTKAGCNQGLCHGNATGKGGLKLSLRGEDPEFDLEALTHGMFARRINPYDPDSSLALLKATGRVPHEGGIRFDPASDDYRIVRSWIAAGARTDPPNVPVPVRLVVTPSDGEFTDPVREVNLSVQAHFSDGSVRDVKHRANYESSELTVSVDAAGKVSAERTGEAAILVRYLDTAAVARLTFLPDRPDFKPASVGGSHPLDIAAITKLNRLRVDPSPPCDDHILLRRTHLDLIGRLPTTDEARAWSADRSPDRHAKLVDRLLERPEFVDHWTLKWADVLRADPLMLDPVGAGRYLRWVKRQVAADRPLNELVTELLTGAGSTYSNPPASFARIHRTPEDLAENTAQLFMGVRLKCARCHNHPSERWTMADFYGMAAFFARIQRKNHSPPQPMNNVSAINGEELITLAGDGEAIHPRNGSQVAPRLPGDPSRGLAPRVITREPRDRRALLAAWLVDADNPFFARAMANRIWFHVFGRGIVEPVDDFRDSNPPSNPQLLDALAAEFVRGGFRLKPVLRTILSSQVYRFGSKPTPGNKDDTRCFSHSPPRRLSAEVLLDAIGDVTGLPEEFEGLPRGLRAVQLPGGRTRNAMLRDFGKPGRLTVCECERTEEAALTHSLYLINSPDLVSRIEDRKNVLGKLLARKLNDEQIQDELSLAALSRLPTSAERDAFAKHRAGKPDRRDALEDLLWAYLNAKEFLFRL